MDIETAIKRRNQIKTYRHVALDMLVYIAPKRSKDYQMFIDRFFDDENKEELAKGFSIDQQFKLCAIWTGKNEILNVIPDIDKAQN